MDASLQRFPLFKAGADIGHQRFFIQRPTEFLEIHGVHFDMALFRGNDNILDILLNGDQRASFYKIVATVCHQILNGLSSLGE